jgi:hypothetical protein
MISVDTNILPAVEADRAGGTLSMRVQVAGLS